MTTWVGALIETKGRADFWELAGKYSVQPLSPAVPLHALIVCVARFDVLVAMRLAEALSRELGGCEARRSTLKTCLRSGRRRKLRRKTTGG
jgi:hypothetical protein